MKSASVYTCCKETPRHSNPALQRQNRRFLTSLRPVDLHPDCECNVAKHLMFPLPTLPSWTVLPQTVGQRKSFSLSPFLPPPPSPLPCLSPSFLPLSFSPFFPLFLPSLLPLHLFLPPSLPKMLLSCICHSSRSNSYSDIVYPPS